MHAIDDYTKRSKPLLRKANHNHTYILDRVVTHGGKRGDAREWLVGRRGAVTKNIFTEKEGKSGTARAAAVNVVRTISTIIRRFTRRNEGHLFRTISSFATLCHISSIVRFEIREWRPMERKRAFSKETRKKKRNNYDSYLFFLLLFTRDCHDCSILLHPSQPVLVATDFRLPPPSSSVIAIAVTTHNGNRTCCVSPFVACESRERFLCSNGTQDRRGYIVQLLLLRRAITSRSMAGGREERRRESLKTFASRPRDCEWKANVRLSFSLSLLYAACTRR